MSGAASERQTARVLKARGIRGVAVRLCDMGIRQNRFGLPESPTVTQVRSEFGNGLSFRRS
ncbi:MAG: hypothetical protein ACP5I4_10535 [Oceanipulchritudo sp.]